MAMQRRREEPANVGRPKSRVLGGCSAYALAGGARLALRLQLVPDQLPDYSRLGREACAARASGCGRCEGVRSLFRG